MLLSRQLAALLCVVMWIASVSVVFAQEQTLQGESEQRARALFKELRCVVCQNQSIDGSNADVARDLRQIVREQISAGKSDSDIRNFLVSRYGEFVLLKPAFAIHTLVLWFAPLLLLAFGAVLIFRSRTAVTATPLTDEEQSKLSGIVSGQQDELPDR